MLFFIFNEIEKTEKDLICFLFFFSFWVQNLTVLLALDLKTACEDGGVLMWFRRRWLWRQFDTISGHGWNRERTQLTKRSTPHNRLHWITQRREDSSEENCKREQTIGSCRKLTKRSTPNNCFHCNLSRPHCQLAVRTLHWSDVDNTETLQAILTLETINTIQPSSPLPCNPFQRRSMVFNERFSRFQVSLLAFLNPTPVASLFIGKNVQNQQNQNHANWN